MLPRLLLSVAALSEAVLRRATEKQEPAVLDGRLSALEMRVDVLAENSTVSADQFGIGVKGFGSAKRGGTAFGFHCKTDVECAGDMVCTWKEQGATTKYCTAKCELADVDYSTGYYGEGHGVWFDHKIGKRSVEACGNYTWTTHTPLWQKLTHGSFRLEGARVRMGDDYVYARGYKCSDDYRTLPPKGDGKIIRKNGNGEIIRTTMHGACYPVCTQRGGPVVCTSGRGIVTQ